jgi:transposase-like protein
VAQALYAIAEGLSTRAAARVFSISDTTRRSWLARAGQHSKSLHEHFLHGLHLAHVQLDEIRLKLYGAAEAKWLWLASDARSKLIPAFTVGARTQEAAHPLVHDVAKRLAPDCLPVFSSDGLSLYFYALTAHFGTWTQAANERRRTWRVDTRWLYAQVVKRYTCPTAGDMKRSNTRTHENEAYAVASGWLRGRRTLVPRARTAG